ncbi:EbsA family protein [Enterococcus columbae]|uniref:Pore-forming protein n=1 Tax=Enterococcus columbae DSM 7374 = ATCC 51263 TaxID=1121865 RepID=S1NG36_9ENTE|nr:EbsA family protein [Enterococcus columbae]EOT44505.1 hypothetical protein OMW_00561 [Enterococcus columbae DSM 7374 = ATCC 51263]EOW84663.1 hypothetical protein I568_01159 [Enterococcus columbae DSM 7374 = ATCC 51263]OJG23551.1 hypothetical protein RR47_GL000528 [Enterococcus columbae DSM 7374 = ATCC 51263]
MNKKLHWQPELSSFIIYWSIAFCIVFYGLILALENTRPYLTSNLVMALGLIFIIIGFKRVLIISNQQLVIHYARFWKVSIIQFHSIQKIEIKKQEITLKTTFATMQFRMSKKALAIFLNELEKAGQKHLISQI